MLFDPTERNVNTFLFQTRNRTMKKLVLTLAIHEDVTIAKAAQVEFIVRTGLAIPFEECTGAKAHRNNEFGLPTLSKPRLIIAVPTNTQAPSPVKVQVRGGWHLPLCTPRLHQGCDSPPHTGKQWPTLLSSMRPDSWAPPVRVEFTCTPNELSCMTTPCIDPHEFITACMSRVCVDNKCATESDTCATR